MNDLLNHRSAGPARNAYTDSPCIVRRVALAAGLLLATVSLVVGFSGEAHAKKDANIVAQVQCANDCLSEEAACQTGCCGLLFCRKSCLSACFTNERICEDDCAIRLGSDPDGAFFDTVTPEGDGRVLRVSGPLQCPFGAVAEIQVTVTQNAGPVANGHVRVLCPAAGNAFTVPAAVLGISRFQPLSTATACGVARIHAGRQGVNALQWCRDVTVLPEGIQLEE